MTRKIYHVQAMARGAMLMQVSVDTRAGQRLALQEALAMVQREGTGEIRTQTEGARAWACYRFNGRSHADLVTGDEGRSICAQFDNWIARGGASAA